MREPWLFLVSVFVYCSGMIHRRKEQEMRERKRERDTGFVRMGVCEVDI